MKKLLLFLTGLFFILTLNAQNNVHKAQNDSSRIDVVINSKFQTSVELTKEKTEEDILYKETVESISKSLSRIIQEKPPNITTIISPTKIQRAWLINWTILLISLLATYVTLTIGSSFKRICALSLTKGLFQGAAYFVMLYLLFTLVFNSDFIEIHALLKLLK